jgi:hypothetical protein
MGTAACPQPQEGSEPGVPYERAQVGCVAPDRTMEAPVRALPISRPGKALSPLCYDLQLGGRPAPPLSLRKEEEER